MKNHQPPLMSRRAHLLTVIKSILLTAVLVIGTWIIIALIYRYTFGRSQSLIFGAIGIWIVLAYVTIPRLHRRLTRLVSPRWIQGRLAGCGDFRSKRRILDLYLPDYP